MAVETVVLQKERWTYADYAAFTPPDSGGYQVIRGELIVTPSPRRAHQWVVKKLSALLDRYVTDHSLGEVHLAPFDVILDADRDEPENIVQPDVLFIAKDRLDIVTDANVQGAPDLAVEILSDSTARYDRVHKMNLYAEFGVRHYWIIDSGAHTLEAFDLTGETPQLVRAVSEDDVFKPELFSDLGIRLSEIWRQS